MNERKKKKNAKKRIYFNLSVYLLWSAMVFVFSFSTSNYRKIATIFDCFKNCAWISWQNNGMFHSEILCNNKRCLIFLKWNNELASTKLKCHLVETCLRWRKRQDEISVTRTQTHTKLRDKNKWNGNFGQVSRKQHMIWGNNIKKKKNNYH